MDYRQDNKNTEMTNDSSDVFSAVYPQIEAALRQHYCAEHAGCEFVIQLNEVLERSFSATAFLTVITSEFTHKLVSKTVVHHEINRSITQSENQSVVEYSILNFLHPKFTDVYRCGVPEPVILLPEIETYIMRFVDGVVLSDLNKYLRYFANKSNYNTLKEYYYLAGRWLKNFQEFTGMRSAGAECLDGVIERCQQRLCLIRSSGDLRCDINFYDNVMWFMDRAKACTADHDVPVCGRHGDFTPWNILAGKDGITVIDFLGYSEEPIYVDVFKMLVFLEDESLSITSSKYRVDCLKKLFLSGYGDIPGQSSSVALLCEAMQRVVSMWGCISGENRFYHHRWETRMRFDSHLNWFKNILN